MLLYLHIPFCDSKCYYCGFNSFSSLHELKLDYSFAICEQLKSHIELFDLKPKSIASVFIGGGTPSCMNEKYYEDFFTILKPYLTSNCEMTSEANPTSASKIWLKNMKDFGINRVSFGVQSFFDDKLKFLGRNHSSHEAKEVLQNAHEIGFKNISLDLIYASKFDDEKRVLCELKEALDLPINHISAYALSLEENTPFFGKEKYVNAKFHAGLVVADFLQNHDFSQYEVSNFGQICKHNLGYWEHKNYLGIGAGAVGFKDNCRIYPNKSVEEYIKNPLYFQKEQLSFKDLQTEKIFLGLRSIVGVPKSCLNETQIKNANFLVQEKKLNFHHDRYVCKDFFLADEIALYLMD